MVDESLAAVVESFSEGVAEPAGVLVELVGETLAGAAHCTAAMHSGGLEPAAEVDVRVGHRCGWGEQEPEGVGFVADLADRDRREVDGEQVGGCVADGGDPFAGTGVGGVGELAPFAVERSGLDGLPLGKFAAHDPVDGGVEARVDPADGAFGCGREVSGVVGGRASCPRGQPGREISLQPAAAFGEQEVFTGEGVVFGVGEAPEACADVGELVGVE